MDGPYLLQAILDSPTRHGIIVTDPTGVIRIWNKGAARIFLYEDEEVIGADARMLFSQDDVAHDVPGLEMASARCARAARATSAGTSARTALCSGRTG